MTALKMFTVLFCTLVMLLGFAMADPRCNKDAWVTVTNTAINVGNDPDATGSAAITSGLNHNDISWKDMQDAITDCLFNNAECVWNDYNYHCHVNPAWIYADWNGVTDIHFDCSGARYVCTGTKWYRR